MQRKYQYVAEQNQSSTNIQKSRKQGSLKLLVI